MQTEEFTKETIVRYTHTYKLSVPRPADVIAQAEEDASGFWSDESLSPEAEAFSDPVITIHADGASGEMFAHWVQAGEASEAPFQSNADLTETAHINMYLLDAPSAASSKVRALLDLAEKEAKEYGEEHDLIFNEDLVALSHDGERVIVVWSTETEN